MRLVKKKLDMQYLIICVLLVVASLLVGQVFIGVSFILGVLSATLTIHKDLLKLDADKYGKKIIVNLILNMVIYATFFLISAYLYDVNGIIICGIALISYRSIFFNRLAKSKGV